MRQGGLGSCAVEVGRRGVCLGEGEELVGVLGVMEVVGTVGMIDGCYLRVLCVEEGVLGLWVTRACGSKNNNDV